MRSLLALLILVSLACSSGGSTPPTDPPPSDPPPADPPPVDPPPPIPPDPIPVAQLFPEIPGPLSFHSEFIFSAIPAQEGLALEWDFGGAIEGTRQGEQVTIPLLVEGDFTVTVRAVSGEAWWIPVTMPLSVRRGEGNTRRLDTYLESPYLGVSGAEATVQLQVQFAMPADVVFDLGGGATLLAPEERAVRVTLGVPGRYVGTAFLQAGGLFIADPFRYGVGPDATDPPQFITMEPSGEIVGGPGQRARFHAPTTDPSATYLWEFDGGVTSPTSSEAAPEVLLSIPGIYLGRVSATNAHGTRGPLEFTYEVRDAPPGSLHHVRLPLGRTLSASVWDERFIVGHWDFGASVYRLLIARSAYPLTSLDWAVREVGPGAASVSGHSIVHRSVGNRYVFEAVESWWPSAIYPGFETHYWWMAEPDTPLTETTWTLVPGEPHGTRGGSTQVIDHAGQFVTDSLSWDGFDEYPRTIRSIDPLTGARRELFFAYDSYGNVLSAPNHLIMTEGTTVSISPGLFPDSPTDWVSHAVTTDPIDPLASRVTNGRLEVFYRTDDRLRIARALTEVPTGPADYAHVDGPIVGTEGFYAFLGTGRVLLIESNLELTSQLWVARVAEPMGPEDWETITLAPLGTPEVDPFWNPSFPWLASEGTPGPLAVSSAPLPLEGSLKAPDGALHLTLADL